MKLMNITCNKCGAHLSVNSELNRCMCQYCGNEIMLSNRPIKPIKPNENISERDKYKDEFIRLQAVRDYNQLNEHGAMVDFYNQFRHTKEYYDKYTENNNQIASLKISSVRWPWWVAAGLLALTVYGIIISIVIVISICISYVGDFDRERKIKALEEENVNILNYIAQEYRNTNQFISIKYASPYIVEKLIGLIDCGRCSTLKEALNTYEMELNNYKQQMELAKISKKVDRMNSATQYMAFQTFIDHI